jgi:hypothetical protein
MDVTNQRIATQVRTANVRFAGERHRDCSLRDLRKAAMGILATVTA